MRQTIFLLILIFISSACSNFHMEKRRYNKGFHISFSKKNSLKKSVVNPIISDRVEKKKKDRLKKELHKTELLNFDPVVFTATQGETISHTDVHEKPSIDERSTEKEVVLEEKEGNEIGSTPKLRIPHVIKNESIRVKNNPINGAWYFAIFAMIPAFAIAKKPFYRLGTWAADHKRKGQFAIAGLYALGFSSSYLLGNILNPRMEEWMALIPLAISGSIIASNLKGRKRKVKFIKQRVSFTALNTSSFFASFAMGAQSEFNLLSNSIPGTENGLSSVALVFITLVLGLFIVAAIFGVAALSCSLACSGSGVWALIVLIGGTFTVIFFGAWALFALRSDRAMNRENVMRALKYGLFAALCVSIPILLSLFLSVA